MKALKNTKMRIKLFILTVPLMIAVIASVIIAATKINHTEEEVTAVYYDTLYTVNSDLINADRDLYQALIAASEYKQGRFSNAGSSELEADLADYEDNKQQVLDRVAGAADEAKDVSSLYNDTKASNGQSFAQSYDSFTTAFKVWEQSYSLTDRSGSWDDFEDKFNEAREYLNTMQEITETWAVNEHALLSEENSTSIITFAVIFGIIIVALFVLVIIILKQITSNLSEVTDALNALANGDLGYSFPGDSEIGKDEIGSIHLCAKNLSLKLGDIIGNTKRMSEDLTHAGTDLSDSADQASQASSQVTEAVNEISEGAVSQAESVETAAHDTSDIGDDIDQINKVISILSQRTDEMKNTCNATVDTMHKLLSQNAEVVKSMEDIQQQISATNNAVKDIAEASQIITDISSQTNLLSLNASIEAARAGESGKGFAVVATEIGNLADQSGNAAVKISKIVSNLVEESEKSVSTIQLVRDGFEKQNEQINSTGDDVRAMASEVNDIASETAEISQKVENLNSAKESLVSIISDLSAVSEENAASTQETNASMEELNATFSLINESAAQLRQLAHNLTESISFFKN